MYGWAHNCMKEMIISEYGIKVWQNIVSYDTLEVYEWKDAVLYRDEAFFAMVEMVVTLPELNSEKVLHLYGAHVLQYLRNKSLEVSEKVPLARSLYDHMVSLAGVYATMGIMSFTFPVKVWCSNGDASNRSRTFYLYSRVEGDEEPGFSQMLEGTVQAVASQYFGSSVEFDRCATQGLDGNAFHKWKITETPLQQVVSAEEEQDTNKRRTLLKQGLSPSQLDDSFPFHIVFNSDLTIVQSGDKCSKLISTDLVGHNISEMFRISVDYEQANLTWDDLQSQMQGEKNNTIGSDVVSDFCLATTTHRTPLGFAFRLIGLLSMSSIDKIAVFLCSPDVASLTRMKDLGVVMHDLPKEAKLQLQKDALSETMHGMTIMNANQDEFAVRQLKQALTSAQDKLVTKQSFVRYVSHEIRTPLMVVDIGLVLLEKDLAAVSTNIKNLETIGNCDGAKSHVSKISHVLPSSTVSDDEEEKIDNGMGTLMNSLDIVKECKCSMGVAIGILNDLLAYEKIESGVFQLNKKTVPATRFIKETIDEFKLQANDKNIKLKFVNMLPSSLLNESLYLYVDPKKIKQVVRNFMSNAIKFTSLLGTVTTTMKSSRVGCGREDDVATKNLSEEEVILMTSLHSQSGSRAETIKSARGSGSGDFSCVADNGESSFMDGDPKSVNSRDSKIIEDTIHVDGNEYKMHSNLILSFLDTGAGISQENQHHVFHSIVQFKPDELQEGGGSGLGLYISRGIVKAHGGETGLYSKGEGEGSNFFFTLPLYTAVTQPIAEDVESACATCDNVSDVKGMTREKFTTLEENLHVLNGMRVLVVDDSTMVRKMLSNVLKRLGCNVTQASDGQEAIDIVRTRLGADLEAKIVAGIEHDDKEGRVIRDMPFDLILMDSVMPRVSGVNATEIITKNLGFTNTVIGVTGNILPADTTHFLLNGATAVLPKPLIIQDLADVLHRSRADKEVYIV